MAGIYFHIPFCKQACHYCDFHFSTNLETRVALVASLRKELKLQQNYLGGERVETVYFGGGTPSMLPTRDLAELLDDARNAFPVLPDAEITIEANPDDLYPEKLRDLRSLGFNRLSIGIQSFDDETLKFLNRVHNSQSAISCVKDSRAAGFDNVSIDLIYSIPGLTETSWKRNVEKAIELQPEHISAYSLTIEPKTVFGNWYKKGKITPIGDDASAKHLEDLIFLLQRAGYQQYEVSNFAKPGFESKHNSNYWNRKTYLGIGPSAHSYNRASRQFNVSNNNLYIKALADGKLAFEKEVLSREDQINEYLLTTLRTRWGCDLKVLQHDYDYDLLSSQKFYINRLIEEGLATIDNDILFLTQKGKMMADKISADLFLISA